MEDSDRISPYVWRVSLVVIMGSIMSILDTTIVNVALDTLGRELHSSLTDIQWVVTGYMLALATVIPITGWASRRIGAKRVYILSLVLFTIGSVLCGLASTTGELILFRVLQGAGGGMLLPVGQLMMAEAAGPKRMGRVMGIVAVPAMLAPILGPTLGGVILENLSWRWIFFVNLPISIVAVVAAVRVLPTVKPSPTERLDALGLALMSIGATLLTYGLAEIGATGGFSSPKVIGPCVAGIVLIIAFVLHALRAKRPLFDVRLYRRTTFAAASFAMFCVAAALFGGMVLLPIYWQSVRLESVIHTGLLVAPQGIGAALAMPIAGKLTDRLGGGPLALFGVTLTTIATIPFALIGAHTSIPYLCVVMAIRGVGIGFAFMPAMAAAFAALDRRELSDATPQLNVLQRIGGSIGVALLAVVLQRATAGAHTLSAVASGYGTAFWASTALTAAAIIPCVILMRAEAAARAAKALGQAPETNSIAEAVTA